MNDFTKEELYVIVDALILLNDQRDDNGISIAIGAKAISMIDNYCEHELVGECELLVDVCKKCKFIF